MDLNNSFAGYAEKAVAQLAEVHSRYDKAAKTSRKAFLRGLIFARWLGALAALLVFVSALRLESVIVDILPLSATTVASVKPKLGQVLGVAGLFFSFLAFLVSKSVSERGNLKGWVRYAVTRQQLLSLKNELALVVSKPGNDLAANQEAALTSILAITKKAGVLAESETTQWSIDVTNDLTAYLGSLRDAGSLARQRLKEQPLKDLVANS